MATLHVRVTDISGSRSREVEAPDDIAVDRIIALLVERMNLPLNSPDGQIMIYKLHHRRTGQQLLDNQTFSEVGVGEGDELRLQPEITAGGAGSNKR
ncbi:MAG: EsaB/YukD family protein [bacterium]